MESAGLSRVTIGQRLGELFEASIIREGDGTLSSGGRPKRQIELNNEAGLIAAADVGETHLHVGIADLAANVLADKTIAFDLTQSPESTLSEIAEAVDSLLASNGRRVRELIGMGLSLPAPVNFLEGTVVGPSVMAGWDDFDIRSFLSSRISVPVTVDNDVNILALAESACRKDRSAQIAFVKVGTGIGCGIIADNRLFRGASGAAGDIGHIQVSSNAVHLCRCGKLGCVEAYASGWALARDLRDNGFDAHTARDVVALARSNVPIAIQLVRQAGRVVGEVVADLVSILNPDHIIIGGMLSETGHHLLAGVKEMVYQRCLPLATRNLSITLAGHRPLAGVEGAALLVRSEAFSNESANATVNRIFDNLHPRI
ncbi:sugar kinase [Labrys miyagiensis]|uniref:Sugar kinase n=1 Tax=Labrys miyagiensis TaxID=346912 RepID=A0ABQ6CH48_9HYPH|nr:ROK family protein [Labrys miyagiensis]GLS19475.1 sugar kinase [Labrys miyagiensis]